MAKRLRPPPPGERCDGHHTDEHGIHHCENFATESRITTVGLEAWYCSTHADAVDIKRLEEGNIDDSQVLATPQDR